MVTGIWAIRPSLYHDFRMHACAITVLGPFGARGLPQGSESLARWSRHRQGCNYFAVEWHTVLLFRLQRQEAQKLYILGGTQRPRLELRGAAEVLGAS